MTREQAREAKSELIRKYRLFDAPFSTRGVSCGIDGDVKKGYFIVVRLGRPLPEGSWLPKRCKGVRVHIEIAENACG